MRVFFWSATLFVSASCIAQEKSPPNDAVGLWQFPDRGVWVQVDADGSTFQCRNAPSGTIFKSEGKFRGPHSIEWQEIWGIDEVSFEKDSLTLTGKWGKFTYRRATEPMYGECLSARVAR